ncbi:MAG: Yip1 family protein [Planctomycetota bacterium]
MRCKTCDYRLWNLRSRQCPECGTPFRPSEFEFVPNSVQFCCPHCNQAYYGTGAHGHLVPPEFDCVSCSAHLQMDDMVLRPTAGLEEEETQVERMPWLERKVRGGLRAWLSTVRLALIGPGRLMRLTPLTSSTATAWWFAIFTHVVLLGIGAIPILLFWLVVGRMVGPGPGLWALMSMGLGGFWCGGILGVLVSIVLEGLIAHGLLRLTGKTAGGLGRTYQAVCYSSGANVATAVPCLGWYFGWLWWPVSAIVMVKEGQRVHGGRAALAVLTLPALVLAGLVALWVWAFTTAMSMSTTGMMGRGPSASPPTETQTVLNGVLAHAKQHSGRGPDHALQLVADGLVSSLALVVSGTATEEEDVPLGSTSLDRFDRLSSPQKDKLVRAMRDGLPEGVIAHRLGDFVFTYHGMDLDTADRRLWVVIRWPDPDANPLPATSSPPGVSGTCLVGLADGSVRQTLTTAMAGELAVQNALRATIGLPALPHPGTVTHSAPAAGPAER